jgi:hypothetical protein
MSKRLMKAIFLLSLIVSMVSSEALGKGPEDKEITDLYHFRNHVKMHSCIKSKRREQIHR